MNREPLELAVAPSELDAIIDERGLLDKPRPTVDREKLQHHLREVLRHLHVDLEDENLADTPRRWSESLGAMTSGGDIPEEWVSGASKIPRIVEVHMRRLQSQEILAHDVADTIDKILEPRGIAVWMGGVHMCMVMRGVEQEQSFMETNVLRGEFLNDERSRNEFMSIVNRRGTRD